MSGGARLVVFGAVCAAAVAVAAAGWLSPNDDTVSSAQVTSADPTSASTETMPSRGDAADTSAEGTTTTAAAEGIDPANPAASTVAASTVPTTTPATTVAPVGSRSLSVLLTGDILTENPVLDAGREAGATTGVPYDFSSLFAPITPLVQAVDLAICQMEVPIGRPGEEPGSKGRSPFGGNLLLAPYEMAVAIDAAGFDRCTTASNHSYDLGDAGIDSTIDAFEQVGISWSGTARRPEEAPPTVFEARGVRVAHLSYTTRSNTEAPVDDWRLNLTTDASRVAADVAAMRDAGAELVIVSVHLFKEMTEQPIDENRQFAEAITAGADIDALIHHGPHVVQGFEVVNDTPTWWSVGNLLSGMARPGATGRYADPRSRDGLAAVLRFQEDGPGVWELETSSVVLCNERASRVIYPGVAAATDPALAPELRQQLQGCVDRTRNAIPDAE